jgi:hypothetical protein
VKKLLWTIVTMFRKTLSGIWIGLVFATSAFASNPTISVKAVIEKNMVTMGEPFGFQIQVEGIDNPGTPKVEEITGFSVESLGGQTQNSSSITIVNGKVSKVEFRGYVFSYRLTPQKAGKTTIPSISVPIGSKALRTQPITVWVTQPKATDDFKLDLQFSKTEFYLGEPVVLSVIWSISKNVQNVAFNLPILNNPDFLIEDPKVKQLPNRQYYNLPVGKDTVIAEQGVKVLDGKQFTTLSFRKILIAGKPGVFKSPEASVSCKAMVGYSRQRKRLSPFDDFFNDDFFSLGRKPVYKTFVARSEPVVLTVLAIPEEGKPANFSGYVGHYQVETSATPTQVHVGDPITLTISINGPEYLEKVELPPLSDDSEFAKSFKIPEEMAAGSIKDGAKVFAQTLRAKSETVKEIPPFKLSYFDPDSGTYRIAKSKPIPIEVKATRVVTAEDAEGRDASVPLKSELEAWSQGIAHNYEGPDVLVDQNLRLSSLLRSPLWIMAFTLPLSLYLVLFVFVQLQRKKMADPGHYRSRKALAQFKRRMKRLKMVEHDPEAYAALLNDVRRYLGDKLRMNGAAMTFADVEEHLRPQGIDSEILNELRELFTLCDQGRYGGSVHLGQSFEDLFRKTTEVIQALDQKM